MLSYYGSISAEVYDLDKPIGHSFGDVEYYYERLKNVKGRVLEPACGTGRILIPLLEMGIDMEGFDLSDEMLSICKKNLEKRDLNPKLYKDNMIDFKNNENYEAIIVPTGTFLLLHKREDSIRALKNFYDHLKYGGKFIVDTFLPTDFEIGKLSTNTYSFNEEDTITLENKLMEVNFIEQYSVSYGKYEKRVGGKLADAELERFPLRWYGVEEFKLILEDIGFKEVRISSNYEFGKYPVNTDDTITYECIK